MVTRVQALVTQHGTERVSCSGWSAELSEIVNDPARVSGMIGPLGPSGRFHYRGDLAVFERVLAKYAALPQQSRIVYLRAGSDHEYDFDLSITYEGYGFLHLNTSGRIPLEQLKIPAGVAVEHLPEGGEPIDPQEKARLVAQQKRIADFVAAHKASSTGTLGPGALSPAINALASDGNAFLPEHVKGKLVLLVFWSLREPASIRQFGVLENLRKEFDGQPLQIISLCIDEDWEAWQRVMRDQGPVDFGDGAKPFDSDHQWWQLIQAPRAPATAAAYGVTKTPAAFLIGSDWRLVAANVPSAKQRDTVNAALQSVRAK
jgi:Thioredoxin-like